FTVRNERDFALCGARPKGFSPFGNLASCAQLDQLCRGFAAEKIRYSFCAKLQFTSLQCRLS
ncbi:MAG: hypothetical protein NC395_08450, partial [Prevotella sp.]|nr:hypothetical protein [Prevotella sp.]